MPDKRNPICAMAQEVLRTFTAKTEIKKQFIEKKERFHYFETMQVLNRLDSSQQDPNQTKTAGNQSG